MNYMYDIKAEQVDTTAQPTQPAITHRLSSGLFPVPLPPTGHKLYLSIQVVNYTGQTVSIKILLRTAKDGHMNKYYETAVEVPASGASQVERIDLAKINGSAAELIVVPSVPDILLWADLTSYRETDAVVTPVLCIKPRDFQYWRR